MGLEMQKRLSAIRISYEEMKKLLSLKSSCDIVDVLADSRERSTQSFRIVFTGRHAMEYHEREEITNVPLEDLQECRHVWRNKDPNDSTYVVCERCGKEGLVD